MIYNCTMFFNEFKLLELKIAEELAHCDKMIIVESRKTHANNEKPLHLKDHPLIDNPKIIYKSDVGDIFTSNRVFNEGLQRDSALWELHLEDDDIVISSDIDEINSGNSIPEMVKMCKEHGFVKAIQTLYYYKINLKVPLLWYSSFAATGKYLKENHNQLTLLRRKEDGAMIPTDGKHFSYLGTPEDVFYKMKNFMHWEYQKFADLERIKEKMTKRRDVYERLFNGKTVTFEKVDIDETYPESILENLSDWESFIEV